MTMLEERWEQVLAWLAEEHEALRAQLEAGRTLDEAEAALEANYSYTVAVTVRPINVQVMLSSLNTTAKARGGAEMPPVG